jgi:chemotaxis protein MotA
MDITTLLGIALGLACIVLGQMLEGGHLGSMFQVTAAIIVLGGTAGAVITQFPLRELMQGVRQSRHIFTNEQTDMPKLVKNLIELSRRSRREGLLALENEATRNPDPFLVKGLTALIDGSDVRALRTMLDNMADQEEQAQDPGPRLLEAAGGYAPTIGILGAVLGLIHVMENLSNPSKLGAGIAVAFVATVYGVGTANLIFLPLAQKLRMKMRREMVRKAMITEGICGIQEGLNPAMLEKRLQSFIAREG